jgi:hypothetical protein
MTTAIQITPKQAASIITKSIKARLTPMMHGSPAIGKSSIVHQVAKKFNLKVIDLRLSQCDPTDLLGFPTVTEGKASYMPMDTFPVAGDALPEIMDEDNKPTGKFYDGWLLFLDELPIAPPAVQAAAYKLILDRMVGNHHLHTRVAIVAAGNLESDNALVQPMSTALQSRMKHIELKLSNAEWLEWAFDHKLDFRITAFIQFKPDALYTFRPDHTDHTYASPRTWEFANRTLGQLSENLHEDPDALPMLAGDISEGVAFEFIEFCKIENQLPKMQSIILDPLGTHVPREPSVLFLLSGAIAAKASQEHMDNIIKYASRMPAEFQVVCLREVIKRNLKLMGSPAIQKWVMTSGVALF